MGVTGLEQNQVTTENNSTYENTPEERWPDSGTDCVKTANLAPELVKIIDCWDDLPKHIKDSIKALVDTAKHL